MAVQKASANNYDYNHVFLQEMVAYFHWLIAIAVMYADVPFSYLIIIIRETGI